MTKAKISEYDAVAANNTDVNGVNIAEGCPPSGMNNMGREIMAALKRFETGADGDSLTVGGALVVSGTATTNTLTAGPVSATTLNTSGQVVFNDAGADVDFRVEGDTQANLLFVDASADNVGIGTNTPPEKLYVVGPVVAAGQLQGLRANSITIDYESGTACRIIATGPDASTYLPIVFASTTTTTYAERMRITDTGRVRINTTSTLLGGGEYLTVNGQTAIAAGASFPVLGVTSDGTGSQTYVQFYLGTGSTNTGNITTNGSTTTYGTSSDYRLKENIASMTGALDKVSALKPVTYTWKESGLTGEGFIAHELAEVCPDAVAGEKDDVDENGKIKPQSIDTSFLVATLTAAIQELKAELDTVKAELATLKGQ